jgi:hypothetical protein
MGMKSIEPHPTDPTQFRLNLSLPVWEQIGAWLNENNIGYYSAGDGYIGFKNQQDAVMFALRWI